VRQPGKRAEFLTGGRQIKLNGIGAVVAAVLVGSVLTAGAAGVDGPRARAGAAGAKGRIARTLRQSARTSHLNSMVYGVWQNGRPLVTGALGHELPGVPASRAMHFRIGNVTEAMTCTLLLRLVDQRKVRLSDPVSRWFPRLPRARQVTLRMLATSTSGYRDYVTSSQFSNAFETFPFRHFNTMSLIRLGTGLPPVFSPPGSSWAFSDTNFLLLGAILQKITHQPLRTALRRQILGPLGLRQTLMPTSANIPPPVMHAYSNERGHYEETTFWNPSWLSLNGSMISSLYDMGKWASVLGTGSLLSRRSHRLQVGPGNVGLGPLKRDFYYGMGVIVSKGWITTNPQLVGYNGAVSYFPAKKLTVVVFATIGPHGDIVIQDSTQAVKQIARILTPRSVPLLQADPRRG
jgi:D-alanyl-D-alanine carboxypeptidase